MLSLVRLEGRGRVRRVKGVRVRLGCAVVTGAVIVAADMTGVVLARL